MLEPPFVVTRLVVYADFFRRQTTKPTRPEARRSREDGSGTAELTFNTTLVSGVYSKPAQLIASWLELKVTFDIENPAMLVEASMVTFANGLASSVSKIPFLINRPSTSYDTGEGSQSPVSRKSKIICESLALIVKIGEAGEESPEKVLVVLPARKEPGLPPELNASPPK